jgi:hypothetical protein
VCGVVVNKTENVVMLKTPEHAISLFAFAVLFALAGSGVSMAAADRFPESGMGTQKEPTIIGDRTVPKKQPSYSIGTVTGPAQNPNVGPLKAPEMRESGMGRLDGGEKQGDKNTPQRNPTFSVTIIK